MNTRFLRRANILSTLLAGLLCAATVQAAPMTLEMPREKQLASTWCWAAVSSMALNSFPMTLPEEPSTITQLTVVALNEGGMDSAARFNEATFRNLLTRCRTPGNCGGSNVPFLYNAQATQVPAGKVLTKAVFKYEIGVRKRPVIITWDYGHSDPNAGTPSGMHLLIITGYNPSTRKVRVFDPWPVDNGGADDPARRKRERWIPYKSYVDPVMDMGQPVTAIHTLDLYQLRRQGEDIPAVPKYPKLGTLADETSDHRGGMLVAGGRPIRAETFAAGEGLGSTGAESFRPVVQSKRDLGLQRVEFAAALAATKPKIDRYVSHLKVTLPDGNTVRGRKRLAAATAFPLVMLDTAQILNNRDKQEALFERKTSVLLVPVIDTTTHEVIDSFLIYNQRGDWKIGGYANTEIAAVLVQQRKAFTSEQRRAEDFFAVSVPEQSAFYFAHGAHGSVQLVSVDNQGRDSEGKDTSFTGAGVALEGLARSINESAKKGR
jgi:hypothetical protein